MKKVLGLVVSERKLGNSELILKEIMAGVPDPCVRELIRLTELEIKPCRGCYRCLGNEAGCNIKDDFDFVIKNRTRKWTGGLSHKAFLGSRAGGLSNDRFCLRRQGLEIQLKEKRGTGSGSIRDRLRCYSILSQPYTTMHAI